MKLHFRFELRKQIAKDYHFRVLRPMYRGHPNGKLLNFSHDVARKFVMCGQDMIYNLPQWSIRFYASLEWRGCLYLRQDRFRIQAFSDARVREAGPSSTTEIHSVFCKHPCGVRRAERNFGKSIRRQDHGLTPDSKLTQIRRTNIDSDQDENDLQKECAKPY
jgi:hypothetical protein